MDCCLPHTLNASQVIGSGEAEPELIEHIREIRQELWLAGR